jgi:hypothetical protein
MTSFGSAPRQVDDMNGLALPPDRSNLGVRACVDVSEVAEAAFTRVRRWIYFSVLNVIDVPAPYFSV